MWQLSLVTFIRIITIFVFLYPIIMTFFWVGGGLIHRLKHPDVKIKNDEVNRLTILVPVYNEEADIKENLEELLKFDYDNYQIIVVDDLSTDNSLNEIRKVKDSRIKVVENKKNIGKAASLNYLLDQVNTEYFVVVDSDTRMRADALKIINEILIDEDDEKVVAYTGNVTVRGRRNKIYFMQKVEYRAFIGMIKRTQNLLTNSILTLSGACAVYKTQVIRELGGFNPHNATEDIEMSWRLNANGYHLKYIPDIKASVTTPMNTYDLIIQRKRWTTGLAQAMMQNFKDLLSLKNNRLKFYATELTISFLWAISFFIQALYYSTVLFTRFFEDLLMERFLISIIILLIVAGALAFIAYKISINDNENVWEMVKHYWLFPSMYWLIQPFGFIMGLYEAVFHGRRQGLWRQKEPESFRLIWVPLIDSYVLLITSHIALEVFQDLYKNLTIVNLDIAIWLYVSFTLIFTIIYLGRWRMGEQIIDRKLPLYENSAFYIGVLMNVLNFYFLERFVVANERIRDLIDIGPYFMVIYLFLVITSLFYIDQKHSKKIKKQ